MTVTMDGVRESPGEPGDRLQWRELRTNTDEKTGDSRTGKTERKRGLAADLRSLRSKLGACHEWRELKGKLTAAE